MKRVILFLIALCVLLCLPFAFANPIIPEYINELLFTNGSWLLEVGTSVPTEMLDGWKLSSNSGTAAFKPGIKIGNGSYVLLTPDSLLSPLSINPAGDSITMTRGAYEHYAMDFGDGPDKDVRAPAPGWSIAFNQFYYLDTSPTPGAKNDFTGGMVTVRGVVRDSATLAPIAHAGILEQPGDWMQLWFTSDSGTFSIPAHAHNFSLWVSSAGYHSAGASFSMVPDQQVDTVILLSRVTALERSTKPENALLLRSYPNPFNPRTTIAFGTPVAGKVTLQIYSTLGRQVAELVRGPRQAAEYQVTWNGTDDNGNAVASGVYLVRLRLSEANHTVQREKTVKILLIR